METFKREHPRVYITFYLRVFDQDRFIGFAVDISDEGIKIISDYKLEVGKDYELEMMVPGSMKKKDTKPDKRIRFTANCLWSKHDYVEKEFYISGFRFNKVENEDRILINKMIEQFRKS